MAKYGRIWNKKESFKEKREIIFKGRNYRLTFSAFYVKIETRWFLAYYCWQKARNETLRL